MNHSLKTRALSLLLAVVMVFGMVPVSAMASEVEETSAPAETTIPVASEEIVMLASGDEEEEIFFTVTFDAQNGTDPVEQSVESGMAAAKPEDPALEGYTFLGWYNGETAWDFEAPVTEEVTLTAKWQENQAPTETAVAVEPSETTVTTVPTESEPAATVHVHTGGAATCKELAVCKCGETYGELAAHIPTDDDNDCTTEIVCTVCSEVTTEAAEMHTPNEEGNVCAICGAEIPVILIEEETVTYNGGLQLGMTNCDYYNIIESGKYTLVPGATEYQYILNDDSGNRRQVVHVIEVDTKNPNVSVMPSFKNIDNGVDYTDVNNHGSITVTEHAAHVEKDLGKNVIGGMNVSLSWDFYHPYGLLLYEGEVLHDSRAACEICGAGKKHPGGGYLVIKKDGTAELRDPLAPVEADDWMAQTVCFSYIVKDGKNLNAAESHTAGDPRSVIGIKEDGTLVMMMVDGRLAPYSAGFTNHEMAEIMIALGCVDAINCDGGGSSTFMTEREGSGKLTVKSRFSDGAERQTLTALLVLSNMVATGEFDHAAIETDVKLVTPGSQVTFTASGADAAGGPADLPADVTWQMADASMGTVENGVFTSNGTVGTATVQMVYNGEVVGEGSVEIVIPTAISFDYPNMTAPYGKSINLDVSAVYGNSPVTLKAEDLIFTLSNESIGTIEGTTFTAVAEMIENPSSNITATLLHNTEVIASGVVNLGRGSEVVYDFESGAESISQWVLAYKGIYTPDKYYFDDELSVVSAADGGKVRNGEYALKVTVDGDSITCMNWCQTKIQGMDIDLTDAVSLSFWMYIPEGSHGLEWDFGNAIPVGLGHWQKHGTGWQYFTVNVADIGTNVTNLNEIRLYHSDTNNDGNGYVHNEEPNYYADVVFYIDDLTVNFSSAVDDNQAPVITNAAVSHDAIDTPVAMEGQTLAANKVTFTAKATDDYSGLDASTAAVYVDGVKYAASCSDSGVISSGDMTLANGAHVVRFEICDKMGNRSTFFEYYVVLDGSNAANTITYGPNDPTLANVSEDSVVWMDLTADAIEQVEKVVAVVDLDQNSIWELDHMELTYGFSASYSVDPENNDATITITRTGDVSATGRAVLASLPIRVWSPVFHHDGSLINEDASAYRLVSVMSHVEKGVLNDTNGATTTFGSLVHETTTEWNGTRLKNGDKSDYHIHTAMDLEDKKATCTTNGYTGRTFCEGCNSVVAWGTSEKATGHSYAIDAATGLMQCSCGDKFTGTMDGIEYVDGVANDGWVGNSFYANGTKLTGVQKVTAPDSADEFYYDFGEDGICEGKVKYSGMFQEGDLYRYSYLGVLTSGWQTIENEWYYFSSSTMAAVSGKVKVGGVYFDFEENGELTSGVWVNAFNGWRYYYGPAYYDRWWQTIDGHDYYFINGYRVTGIQNVRSKEAGGSHKWYEFDENGVCLGETNGIHESDGVYYYTENGVGMEKGLICVDGEYYYALYNGRLAADKTFRIWQTNCNLPIATYSFGSDGKMLGRSAEGEIINVNGILCYYENGIATEKGLICVDGDYYFAKKNGEVVVGETINAYTTSCNLPTGTYTFDADGKMVGASADGEIVEIDDVLYYYENGKGVEKGLVKLGEDYFFAVYKGKLAVSQSVNTWQTSCDLPNGRYEFGADGKMCDGIVEVDGTLYYYENGRGVEKGLIKVGEDYYFAVYKGKLAVSQTVNTWLTNCDLPNGRYEFGADGKMVNGIVERDGVLYYYENGQGVEKGLVCVDGDYYFTVYKGRIAVSQTINTWQTSCDLPNGRYEFGADGKMVNGIVERDGVLYYYENGQGVEKGLVCVDGDYYFTVYKGRIAVSQTINTWQTSCDLPNGRYEFGADGKMLNGIVDKNGVLYYYENGKGMEKGLINVDGNYYFTTSNGRIAVSTTVNTWLTNCDLPNGRYEFGNDGKMLDGIVDKNGVLYYYENGQGVEKNLFWLNGHYYYALYQGRLATNCAFRIWEGNGLLAEQVYTFNELGQIIG